jgi:hypothetical protein
MIPSICGYFENSDYDAAVKNNMSTKIHTIKKKLLCGKNAVQYKEHMFFAKNNIIFSSPL